MENLDLHKELEAFVEAIDTFPASEEKSKFYSIERIGAEKELKIIEEFFHEDQYKKILQLIIKSEEAIRLCKLGTLEAGYQEFQSVDKEAKILSKDAYQYVRLYFLSGLAYYFYKKGDFDRALQYTWKEIEEIENLEIKGLTILHFRRVGHIGNAIKILYTSGQIEPTITLALGNFLYSINGNKVLMPTGVWNPELLNHIPYIRQRYIDISFLNIIEMTLDKHADSIYDNDFFNRQVFKMIPEFEVTNNNLAMIHNWLYLQKLYYQKDYQKFIINLIEYCKEPFDCTFDILKLSHLSKIILLIKIAKMNNNFKNMANPKLNNYIQRKLMSKQLIKEKICHSIFE